MDDPSRGGADSVDRSSFYSIVYAHIEEIGWEHLVRSEADLSNLSFRILDKQGRAHHLEISLPESYPRHAPSVTVDTASHFKLSWSTKARLIDVVDQFNKHLEKLEAFWSMLEDIDRTLCVVDLKQASVASSFRQISVGNDCQILLSWDPLNPRCLPECRFFGPHSLTDILRKNWRKNRGKWAPDKPLPENLAILMEITLPKPLIDVENKEAGEIECGICYSRNLPVDDELGSSSGKSPDYTCENSSCSKAFHSLCLRDWLHSLTTTRQSFDVMFGSCPYCSEAVAIKLSGTN